MWWLSLFRLKYEIKIHLRATPCKSVQFSFCKIFMRRFLYSNGLLFFCYHYKLLHKLCSLLHIKDPGNTHTYLLVLHTTIVIYVVFYAVISLYFFACCFFFISDSLIGATSIFYEYVMYVVFVDLNKRGMRRININEDSRSHCIHNVTNIVLVFVRMNLIKSPFDMDR